ncbi:MAG: hypothetical protein K6F28_09980 [Lachnospiraceae bacterium]|nr:hypothetical protein [Lachnospiraceae bacterium]
MNLFELVAVLSLNKRSYDEGLEDAEKEASSVGEKLRAGLGTASKVAASAIAVTSAAVTAVAKKSVEGYAEQEQLVGGVQKLYGNMGLSLEEYAASQGKSIEAVRDEWMALENAQNTVLANSKQAYKTAGMDMNTYLDTATQFSASLINSLSGDAEKAADLTDVAMRAISDNFNTFGGDMESITNAYKGFSKANYTMLDNLKLGYGGTKEEMDRLIADANAYAETIGMAGDLSIDSFADIITAIDLVQQKQNIAGTTSREAATTIAGSVGMIKSAWSNLITGMADENADLSELIGGVVDSAKLVFRNILPVARQAINGISTFISEIAPVIAEELPGLVEEVVPQLISAASSIINSLVGALPELLEALTAVLPILMDGILEAIPLLIDAIVDAVPVIVDGLIKVVLKIIDKLPQIVSRLVKAIPQVISMLIKGLMNNLPAIITGLIDCVVAIIQELPTIIDEFIRYIPEIITMVIDGLIAALPQLIAGAITLVVELVNHLPEIITSLIEALPTIIEAIVTGLIENLPILVQGAIQLVIGLVEHLPEIIAGLLGAIPGIIGSIVGAFGSLGESLGGVFSGALDICGGILGELGNVAQGVFNWIGTLMDDPAQAIEDAFDGILSYGKKVFESVTQIISGVFDLIDAKKEEAEARAKREESDRKLHEREDEIGVKWVTENGVSRMELVDEAKYLAYYGEDSLGLLQDKKTEVNVGGEITIKGVNDKNEFVGASKMTEDQLARMFQTQGRLY